MTINYDISIMLYNDKQAHVGDMFVGILWGYKPGTVNRDLLSKKNWIPIMGLQPCGRNVWDGLKWCIGAIWYETGDQVMWISSVNQQVDVAVLTTKSSIKLTLPEKTAIWGVSPGVFETAQFWENSLGSAKCMENWS